MLGLAVLVGEVIGDAPGLGASVGDPQAQAIGARIDPKAEREAAWEKERTEAKTKTRKTFKTIAENYIALEVPGLKRGSESEALIRRSLLPEWGDRQVSKIEHCQSKLA